MRSFGSCHRRNALALLSRFSTALVALCLIQVTGAWAAQIGVAAIVQNDVTGTIGGNTTPMAVGNQIFADQRIRTGTSGSAQFLFADQSVFTIGPKSDLTLDRFVYDPNKGTGNVAFETTRGAFRFISGSRSPDSYKITTPVATIGVRGSMVFGVGGPTSYIFYTGEGSSYVIPNGNAIIDNIPAGRAVLILADGQVIITKFDVGQLDLSRLQELLPLFEDFPDSFQDLSDQRGALSAPVCNDADRISDTSAEDPDCE